ncbi:hypothetical protein J0J30_23225, partial [Vibrio vulnificus]|nr:hypothetical protein [Vibrio vulnificus]
ELESSQAELSTSQLSDNSGSDNAQESTSSPLIDSDDTLFDLPDLCIDESNHSCGFSFYNQPWQITAADIGFRLEESFLWDNN